MILKSLQLTRYKNHQNAAFDFGERVNCILGKNGVGKTNLLDAIYYLSFTKSAVSSLDKYAINHSEKDFILFGEYDNLKVGCQFAQGTGKTFKLDGVVQERLSEVIGKVPVVLVLPNDTQMINEGSEERRKFFDAAISQVDPIYLKNLISYNKLLKQRNALLKSEDQSNNYQLIETYDDQLIPLAISISKTRASIAKAFIPFLEKNYQDLHKGNEVPGLTFSTQVDDEFESEFRGNFQRDTIMQRTLLGSHKDDFIFSLNKSPIKQFGSQGQQKTFIIGLKFGLYDFIKESKSEKPLLLLDDIFDKLDDNRIELLISLLNDKKRFGQIFLTDARSERSKELFQNEEHISFIELK